MVVKRETGYVLIINEPAKSRIKNNQCPSCGKPKIGWKRRTDWRCCSTECTSKFNEFCIIRSWSELRNKCFERDGWKCVKCNESYIKCNLETYKSNLIADHINPIALGGKQWDINNLQTLCVDCEKEKTKKDIRKIAELRRVEKKLINGQKILI